MVAWRTVSLTGTVVVLILGISNGWAQVFPPRQTLPSQQPIQPPTQPPVQAQPNSTPGVNSKAIPFVTIMGDPTKSFIQIRNLPNPFDTNFFFGRGLVGRIPLERYTYESGNGQKSYIHIIGSSNPPIVTTEGTDLRLQFVFPTLQFKTFYKDYSGDGDAALTDLVAEKVVVDVFISPTLDQRQYPTYHSIRITLTGTVKEAAKCTHFFDIIFPVNICKIASEYLGQIQPALENGIREILLQPQTRAQFEQQVFQFIRWDLLSKAGVNPNSRAQVDIVKAEFRGTDYVVDYTLRQ